MKYWFYRLQAFLTRLKERFYWALGFNDYIACELCSRMFDTRNGFGGWSDVTSCPRCGPEDQAYIEDGGPS